MILEDKTLLIVNQSRLSTTEKILLGGGYQESHLWTKYFHRVIFLCFSDTGNFLYKVFNKKYILMAVPFDLSSSAIKSVLNLSQNYLQLLIFMNRLIKIFNIALIRTENLIIAGIPTFIISKLKSIPFSIWLVGFERKALVSKYKESFLTKILTKGIKIFEYYILHQSNFVFAISEELYQLTQEHHVKNAILTPNYIDIDLFAMKKEFPSYSGNTKIKFLYAGRFEKEKGLEVLMNAIKIVASNNKNFQLDLNGNGSLRPWMDTFITQNNLQDQVNFLQKVDYSEVPKRYQEHDVFVLPSFTEGMPSSMLEAMCCGCACIATSVGMIPQILKDGINGIMIKPGDPKVLAEKIEFLIRNPKDILKYGQDARQDVEKYLKNYIRIHKTVYEKII